MATNRLGEISDGQSRLIALVAEIARGDQSALAELYDATNRIVYGMALRIVREPSAAEDVALEVYLQVWRTAGNYSAVRASVTSWLALLARSRAIDWLRCSQARFAQRSNSLDEAAAVADGGPDPELACAAAGRSRAIRTSMAALAPEQRKVIELAYFSGLSHSEIAAKLGQPLGTVKSRIRQGMSRLRETLGEYMESGA